MNFIQSVTTSLKKSFTFSGRASRSEFWYFFLFSIILNIIARLIYKDLDSIVMLLLLPASICVTVRRLHDVNRSGWWYWIWFTLIGAFPLLYWWGIAGTNGNNDYGKKPE